MPTLDFPATPTAGDIYTENNVSYMYDGEVWRSAAASAPPDTFVLRAGDTMTGPLMVPDPIAQPMQAPHKKYVDELVAAQSLYQSTWQVAANVPDLDPAVALPLHAYSWTAQTVDPKVPELAPATLPGIGGLSILAGDTVRWNEPGAVYELIRQPIGISQMTIADEPPASPYVGMLWWDSNSGKQYTFFDDGTSQQWVQVSGGGGGSAVSSIVPVGDTPPANPSQGLLWFDTSVAALFIWYDDGTSAQWLEVGPP